MKYISENVPEILKKDKAWVIWHYEDRIKSDGTTEKTKVPYIACQPETKAESNNSNTWSDFKMADMIMHTNKSGIGYVLHDNGVYGIDLDNAFDENGELIAEYKPIIDNIVSYTEKSPSGNGLHILFASQVVPYPQGGLSCKWLDNGAKREVAIFGKGKYFTMTGDVYNNRNVINDIPKYIITETINPIVEMHKSTQKNIIQIDDNESCKELSDAEIINKCKNAKNSGKFNKLWVGNTVGYPSQSEAELALISIFAFYSTDELQLVRLLTQSGMARDKHNRVDYLQSTIKKGMSGIQEHYNIQRLFRSKVDEGNKILKELKVI
jgi:primase-polymerase (primpol)-like protein